MSDKGQALLDVIDERNRQQEQEGFDKEHDAHHNGRELAQGALSYLDHYVGRQWVYVERGEAFYRDAAVPSDWPWEDKWWKPKSPRRDLVRAAAMIIAEIERMDAENERNGKNQ